MSCSSTPHLPNIPPLVIDNGRGKRSATLDLREESGRESLRALLNDADVFLQGYRPGALASCTWRYRRMGTRALGRNGAVSTASCSRRAA